jgi:hypothetical protein
VLLKASTTPASPEDARAIAVAIRLRELMATEEWEAYARELDRIEADLIERLVTSDASQHDVVRGQIDGIRQARSLPARFVSRTLGK